MRRQVRHRSPLAASVSWWSGVLHSGQTRMSRRSLGIGMKAPVSKVDCSKGGEAESSWEAKEGERGYTPRAFSQECATCLICWSCTIPDLGMVKECGRGLFCDSCGDASFGFV